MDKIVKKLINIIFALFVCWTIVLCVFFQNINYVCKAVVSSSAIKIILGILFFGILYLIIRVVYKYWKYKYRTYILIGVISLVTLITQLFILKHYYFISGWDTSFLVNLANLVANNVNLSELGTQPNITYFSIYPNNLFLAYIYSIIIKLHNFFNFKGNFYVTILSIQCIINVVSGVLVALLVKKYTKKDDVAIWAECIYVLLVGLSPWNYVPYSDQMTLIFPVLILFLYSINEKNKIQLGIKWILIIFMSYIGYKIKPQVIIILIAICIIQFTRFFTIWKNDKKDLLISLVSSILGFVVSFTIVMCTLKSMNIPIDKEKTYGLAHFAMMGANTDRMGAWAGEDVEYSASFATREERDIADWKVFKERISEMGVYGCYMQAVRKTLTNYNDGTFAWWQEGGFVAYPHKDISNIDVKIKSVYNIEEEGGYNNNKWSNIMQCIWLTILLSLIFVPINKISCYDKQILVAMLAILGLSLFEIIFECRARYLYSYSPIYVILATIGICSIVEFICLKKREKHDKKKA